MKKTKKEKILAELHRKIALTKEKPTYTFTPKTENSSLRKTTKPEVFEKIEEDNSETSKSLKKTIVLSIFIISMIFSLKFLLKV